MNKILLILVFMLVTTVTGSEGLNIRIHHKLDTLRQRQSVNSLLVKHMPVGTRNLTAKVK